MRLHVAVLVPSVRVAAVSRERLTDSWVEELAGAAGSAVGKEAFVMARLLVFRQE